MKSFVKVDIMAELLCWTECMSYRQFPPSEDEKVSKNVLVVLQAR